MVDRSLKKRFRKFDTIGRVFHDIRHEFIQATLSEKLFGLFRELFSNILIGSISITISYTYIKAMLEDYNLNV